MKVVRPTVFPKPGTYSTNKIHLNIMSLTKGAKVHYTLDGSNPTETSPVYNMEDGLLTIKLDDPFTISPDGTIIPSEQDFSSMQKDFTVKAIAAKEGWETSEQAEFHFGLKSMPKGEYFYTILQEKAPNSPAVIRIEDEYQAKMYFVIGSERAMLIDAGFDKESNLKTFLDVMAEGLPYEACITHAHPDHDAQAQNLIDQGVTVYYHSGDYPTYEQFGGKLIGYTDFEEGHVFDLGDCALKAYSIPGHTVGHMVLLDEENGLLFSSDAFGNNRNTLIDTAFIHLGGGDCSTMDQFLSVLQNFRYETKGKIKKIFFGHNETILNDSYLENLEIAVQNGVDFGEKALTPTLRPEAECFGSSKISLVGNYISDLDWVGVNIINIYSGSYNADNIDTLSAIFVKNGTLEPKFHPNVEEYTLLVEKDTAEIELAVAASSSFVKSLMLNSVSVRNKEFHVLRVKENSDVTIEVTSPDGLHKKNYKVRVKAAEGIDKEKLEILV